VTAVVGRVLLTVVLTALAVAGVGTTASGTTAACPSGSTVGCAGGGAAPTGSVTSTVPASTGSTTPAATTPAPAGSLAAVSGTSVTSSAVVITGHGWGHGVGMAQWGALGFAQHGWTYDRILKHYYRGTTVERRAPLTVRVLLLEGATRATLSSDSPWSVTDGTGTKVKLPAGALAVGPGLTVDGQKLASPLAFTAGRTPLSLAGKQYRGRLVVLSDGKKLQVVNTLKLEAYIKGVVGYEMPHTWAAAALQAQAVAARTYARSIIGSVVTARAYDLYADTRSQVYGGIGAESPEVSAAADATRGMVVLYNGKIVTTYYSSSSGGRTTAAVEAWGKPVPYLVSVADPYDTISPYHDWGPVVYDAAKLATMLKVGTSLDSLGVTTGASGHVTALSAAGPAGQVSIPGGTVRTMLGLRSTFFTVGRLSLEQPGTVVYGLPAEVDGIASGFGSVVLEGRAEGGLWQPVAKVRPDARGAFSLLVRPEATTQYRLAAGDLRVGLVSVTVESAVDAAIGGGAVQGTVKPPVSGASVQVQRQHGSAWRTVASGRTDATGAFALAASLAPGSYRVRCAPGKGLAPGVSPLLAVQ
jgi:stage II sporulation protein D